MGNQKIPKGKSEDNKWVFRRYKRSNQEQNIEERLTTQWTKEKRQKDKQRSTTRYTEILSLSVVWQYINNVTLSRVVMYKFYCFC